LPPSATAPPVAATASAATSEALAAPAPAENPDDIESGTGFANYGSAFCRGAAATFGLFLLLWLYGRIRGVLRPRIRRWLRRTLSDMRRP
ncbi:MAG: hypothetical protein ACE5FI_16265, partial [Anaerolineales bacterium]